MLYDRILGKTKKVLSEKARVAMIITDHYSVFSLKIMLYVMMSKACLTAFPSSKKILFVCLFIFQTL